MAVGKRIGQPVKRESTCCECGARIECEGKADLRDICEECHAKKEKPLPFGPYRFPAKPLPRPWIDKCYPQITYGDDKSAKPMFEVTFSGSSTTLSDYVATIQSAQEGRYFNKATYLDDLAYENHFRKQPTQERMWLSRGLTVSYQ